jgi:RsiW-degrading membrane proteinase PrsW (M82 family)
MSDQSSSRLSYAAVPLWLALSIALPFIAIAAHRILPRMIGNFAFFAPQYLFSFSQVVKPSGYGYSPLFPQPGATIFCASLWLVTTVVYGLIAKRWPRRRFFWLAPIAIIVVSVLVHAGFSGFGYTLQLDGP